MSKLDGRSLRVVLYEGPGSKPVKTDRRFRMFASLLEAGYDTTYCSDECPACPGSSSVLAILGELDEGQTPPATSADKETTRYFIETSGLDIDRVLLQLADLRKKAGVRDPGRWKPWFPVIDYDRCVNCLQCLSFCLFDVYGIDQADRIQVQRPQNCKTDCPACARVCPQVAIIFPKYEKGPINGDPAWEEDLQADAVKVDVSRILGADGHASLRRRGKNRKRRFSTERDSASAEEWDI